MTPMQLFFLIFFSLICLGIILSIILYYVTAIDSLESFLIFLGFLILAVVICPFLNSMSHKDIYSSTVFDVDEMITSIEMQNFTEKTKYISPAEEPYDELEHATLFGTESWKLIHYTHKVPDYDHFKKSTDLE
jgi:hypothetical protein